MNVESELTHTLEEQAARFRPTPTGFAEVVRRGRHRRRLRRVTQGGAVIGVIALAGILVGVLAAPPPEPVVTIPTEATTDPDVVISLCDDRQCPAITEDGRAALEEQLRSDPDVVAFVYESKQEAYERFRVQFADQPDLVESVTFHEMPASFRIDVATGADVAAFSDRYLAFPGVEDVMLSSSARGSLTPTAVPTREVTLPEHVIAVGAGTCPLFYEAGGNELDSHLAPAELVVYDDGRVYVAAGAFAPPDSDADAAAVATLTAAQLLEFAGRLEALDLRALPHWVEPSDGGVIDAGEAVFQVRQGERVLEIRAHALGFGAFPQDVLTLAEAFGNVAAIARESGTPVAAPPDDVPLVANGDICGG